MLGLTNFTFGTVNGTFTAGQVTLPVFTGQGARYTKLPARAVLWNVTQGGTPAQAFFLGLAEVLEISSETTNVLTIVRDVESTGAIASIPDEEYRISVTMTEDQWNLVMRARPDNGAGTAEGFDAVREGTPAVIAAADWLSREVYDDGTTSHDAIKSIQGGPRNGQSTELWLGDTTTPQDLELRRTVAGAIRTGRIRLNALDLLYFESNGVIELGGSTPSENTPSVNFKEKVGFDSMLSFADDTGTIATAALTATGPIMRVNGEGNVDDDLETLTADHYFGKRSIVILRFNSNGVITVKTGVGNITLAQGDYKLSTSARRLALLWDGAGWVELYRTPVERYVFAQQIEIQNVAGGTFTSGAWRTRPLNNLIENLDGIASLSSNQLTLEVGVYRVRISAPAYLVDSHQIKLRNVTDGSDALFGTVEDSNLSQTRSFIQRRLSVVTIPKAYEVQHQCQTTRATDGFGRPANFSSEPYTQFEAEKIG